MSEYGHIFQLGHDWTEDKMPLKNRLVVVYANEDYYVCKHNGDTDLSIIPRTNVYNLEKTKEDIDSGKYDFSTFRYVYVKKAKDFNISFPNDTKANYYAKEIQKRLSQIENNKRMIKRYKTDIENYNRSIAGCTVRIGEITIELDKLKELYKNETGSEYSHGQD